VTRSVSVDFPTKGLVVHLKKEAQFFFFSVEQRRHQNSIVQAQWDDPRTLPDVGSYASVVFVVRIFVGGDEFADGVVSAACDPADDVRRRRVRGGANTIGVDIIDGKKPH